MTSDTSKSSNPGSSSARKPATFPAHDCARNMTASIRSFGEKQFTRRPATTPLAAFHRRFIAFEDAPGRGAPISTACSTTPAYESRRRSSADRFASGASRHVTSTLAVAATPESSSNAARRTVGCDGSSFAAWRLAQVGKRFAAAATCIPVDKNAAVAGNLAVPPPAPVASATSTTASRAAQSISISAATLSSPRHRSGSPSPPITPGAPQSVVSGSASSSSRDEYDFSNRAGAARTSTAAPTR
mmetsp:Transcript_19141/g.59938  ORF Transcript_19141/g.59938 Transcript_19141/m.59938 type:complete len:244 (-) Transcript_19141:19-750(-)